MKPTMNLGVTALVALMPIMANAAPSAFVSKCGALTIKNETKSTLIRDNEDCKLIWVLPPTAGKTELTGYSPTGNLGMCSEVKDAQGMSARVMKRMEETSKDIDKLNDEFKAASEKVVKAKAKVNAELQKPEIQQMNDALTRMESIDARIDAVAKQLESCNEGCESLKAEYKDLGKQRQQLHADIRKMRQTYIASVRAYEKVKAELASAEEEAASVGKGVDEIMARQSKYHKQLLDLLLFYSRIEGGHAHLDYNTGWDEAVLALTQKFGNEYQFRKVATQEVRVFANLIGAADQDTYLSSMPAILDYSIQGVKYQPFGKDQQPEFSSLTSQLVGNIRMSLMGGCPLYYKDFLNSKELKPSDLPQSYNFAITATYKYPAAYRFKMTASYNLYKFYEKIVNSSSSGGFFSSRTSTSISENKIDRDTFHIDWQIEDPNSIYNEKLRQEIASDIKKDLIGRVLGTMAQPVFDNVPQMPVSQPAHGEHGAIVLANGLNSTCGAVNVYCQAGVWVLRGLDAIFGSNSASQSYRATHDRTATDIWSADTVKWNTGATAFVSKQ